MHEMALTRSVLDMVLEEAEKSQATEVKTVYVTIGYMRDIVEDLFEGMFAYLARGTAAEHAELAITRVPLTVKCNGCGEIYHIDVFDKSTWPCPRCGKRDYKINSGMEFFINGIEIVSTSAQEKDSPLKAVPSPEAVPSDVPNSHDAAVFERESSCHDEAPFPDDKALTMAV